MYFSEEVNFEELARCTDDFNGAQCKAVCVEAVSAYKLDANLLSPAPHVSCVLLLELKVYAFISFHFKQIRTFTFQSLRVKCPLFRRFHHLSKQIVFIMGFGLLNRNYPRGTTVHLFKILLTFYQITDMWNKSHSYMIEPYSSSFGMG